MKRAKQRNTLMYSLTPDLMIGIEYNPQSKGEKLAPLANYRVFGEKGSRPALIIGTSSDRIGTPKGQAYYATVSKSLKAETGLPIAPYFGGSYGTYNHRLDPIGGLNIFWTDMFSTTSLYDGVNIHHMLNIQVTDWLSFGVLMVTQKNDREDPYFGVNMGVRF